VTVKALYEVDAPHFNAGVVATDGIICRTAPILGYSIGWTPERLHTYATGKGWSFTPVDYWREKHV
jgi:hypothetical protein